MYKHLIKNLLFQLSPETAHDVVSAALDFPFSDDLLSLIYGYENPALETELFGLKFKNPVGLAAGFDKNAEHFRQLAKLGFGFVEIGTVTPRPQPGNPPPRLFRLPEDRALINRMGFNNDGVEAVARRLEKRPADLIIGGNIGKNKTTPNESAAEDYLKCFRTLFDVVDYFVVNISSPNTPHLRELQEKEPLTRLLKILQEYNRGKSKSKPLLLKISPDLIAAQIDEIVKIALEAEIDGIVAVNTTTEREGLNTPAEKSAQIGAGGLSGAPLRRRSTEVVRHIHRQSEGKLPIIGVGGIDSPKAALEKLDAGASLIQIYTGFIYEGPDLIRQIKKAIAKARR